MRRLLVAALLLVAATSGASAQFFSRFRQDTPGDFALYVLSLSWSPTFCATTGNDRGDRQCDAGGPQGFVLHGLWPQYERGYPENCAGRSAPRIPDYTLNRMLDIMPSRGLVIHEWRAHGTCSGMAPQAYFDTVRRAYRQITIPDGFARGSDRAVAVDDVVQAFVRANPGLPADGVTVTCRSGMLQEVRICLSRTLSPRRCAEPDREACRARQVTLPRAQ